jgi:hypothetical protein
VNDTKLPWQIMGSGPAGLTSVYQRVPKASWRQDLGEVARLHRDEYIDPQGAKVREALVRVLVLSALGL